MTKLVFEEPQGDNGPLFLVHGGVKLKFNDGIAGLVPTLNEVEELNLEQMREMTAAWGFPTHELLSRDHYHPLVAGLVQNAWYERVKGAVPENVAKRQVEREAIYKQTVNKAKEDPESFKQAEAKAKAAKQPKERATKRYSVDPAEAVKAKELKGQQLVVFKAMQGIPQPATVAEIAKAVEAGGELKTNQPIERVVSFYMNKWGHDGLVLSEAAEVAAPATEAAAPSGDSEPAPAGAVKNGKGGKKKK